MRYNLKLSLLDVFSSAITLYASFLLRFEFEIPKQFANMYGEVFLYLIIPQLTVSYYSGLYNRLWKYTSLFDLYAILKSSLISWGISIIVVFSIFGTTGYPRSVFIFYFILNTLCVIGFRLSIRVYHTHYKFSKKNNNKAKLLLLIGAGITGEKIAREILGNHEKKYKLVGFLDDDPEKKQKLLHGKKIFGSVKELPNFSINYDELLITSPSASGDQIRRIIKICKETGKPYKIVPSMNEIIDGEITLDIIRDVSYSDLLGREEVVLDMFSIEKLLRGKRILITGAGGSIGSELLEQCFKFSPSEIICLEISEEKIYNIQQKYNNNPYRVILKTVLGSITNFKECEKIFIENRPHIVFHAAAYKHVPIQELHPWSAVETNIRGTLNLVKLSDIYNVNKFVLVSTDKAVNPANVMGATKRVAEKLIQSYNQLSETKFMAVRFGNVLGSSGSAIPTFQKQINEGGPLTITHPEMTRYFMSIQEASQLILQCGSFGRDGEIFLLEMGKPIKIKQMAKDLIRLSGLEPEIDIPIVYTGLRPGEKLYEELQLNNENKVLTSHKKIMILKENTDPILWKVYETFLKSLFNASKELNEDKIISLLQHLLPSYQPRTFKTNLNLERSDNFLVKGEA